MSSPLFTPADIPFHPLADLFPLMEGAEFDELVSSIREDGLLEPITLLHGSILDGRNRFRACKAADVELRTEIFTGSNPVHFVAAKNMHRRHLTTTQRIAIAGQMVNLLRGSNQFHRIPNGEDDGSPTSTLITVEEAAKIMGVSRDSVQAAKLVFAEGSEDEKAAVRSGEVGARGIADKIRQKIPAEEREKQRREQPKLGVSNQAASQQRNADLWRLLRDGIANITSLPLPADIIATARHYDKKTGGRAIEKRLPSALSYLQEFSDAWNSRDA